MQEAVEAQFPENIFTQRNCRHLLILAAETFPGKGNEKG